MNTFEITIQRKSGDGWPVVVEHSKAGVFLPVRSEGLLQLDQIELRMQTGPLDYGILLGQALFRDDVRDAFARARAESADNLRVLLFVEADDLRTLRWERLCAPLNGTWDFLALDQRVPFSLYLPSITDRRFPPIGRRDLRALILVASPEDSKKDYHLDPFDVADAVSSVRAALGEIPCDVLAMVEGAVGLPTLDTLCKRITAEQYTLLHFVCHGRYKRKDRETILYLAGADNQVDPVAGTRLLERLRRLRGARGLPHFVFLATCESASPEAEGALGGLAQRLVRELGMPAVVAMTEKVSLETAQALAESFYCRLREHGQVDRALVEACAGLAERYDVTVPALYSRLGGRPLFSDTLDRELTDNDIKFGLAQLGALLPKRAPVLQPAFETLAATLRGTLGAEPAALSETARREREEALVEANNLCEEVLDLSFNGLALGQEPPHYDERCPFRGLYPFRAEDREFFFGRECLVKRLAGKLKLPEHRHNFLAVLGPSGSGKSSLVLAGLVPALQAEGRIAYLTPGSDPLAQLETSLSKVQGQPAVLVVDQFEELFTLCTDENKKNKRQTFLDRLLTLAKSLPVVITMRADFLGECAPYDNLVAAIQAHLELIAPMDSAELRSAMEQQAAKVGLRFEADLSNTILDDVQGEPGEMPLLQHALLELWQRRHGRWLRADEYRAIGGVQQAIAQTAEAVYEKLSPEEQERVRHIFVRLTHLDEDPVQGEERRDTRRRVELEELVGTDAAATKELVKRLADARLVVTGVNEVTGRTEVEVAHEALIRYWPRLAGWLDEDRASIRLRERIRREARAWEKAGGRQEWEETGLLDESLLVHRGSRLEDAEALAERPRFLSHLERDYVEACVALRAREKAEEEKQRQRELEQAKARQRAEEKARREAEQRAEDRARAARRLRLVLILLAAMFLVTLGAALVAGWQRQQAKRQAQIALSRQLAAQALSYMDNDRLDLAPLLSVEAYRAYQTAEARSSLLDVLEHNPYMMAFLWLPEHSRWIREMCFGPDGDTVISVDRDGLIISWDVNTRQQVGQPITGTDTSMSGAACSADGNTIAIRAQDAVSIWNLATRKEINHFDRETSRREMEEARYLALREPIALSPDGKRVALGTQGSILLWDVASGQLTEYPLADSAELVRDVAFSPDGKMLAWLYSDDIVLWDIPSETVTHHLEIAADPRGQTRQRIMGLTFNLDGKILASIIASRSASDNVIILWDVATGQPVGQPLTGHSDKVTSVAFSPDGRTLASGSEDSVIIVWDIATSTEILRFDSPVVGRRFFGEITSLAFSQDGQTLASSTSQATILWDVPTGAEIFSLGGLADRAAQPLGQPLTSHPTPVSVAYSRDNILAWGGADGTITLWDVANKQPAGPADGQLSGHANRVTSIALSPDGKTLASGGEDNAVILWDIATGQRKSLTGHTDGVTSVAFSPDGDILASGSRDKTVILWNVASGAEVRRLDGHVGWVNSVAFSPDNSTLASAGFYTIILWDVTTGAEVRRLLDESSVGVNSVAFSPDGSKLASGGKGSMILWSVATGERLGRRRTEYNIYRVTFSPDGQTLAWGSDRDIALLKAANGERIGQYPGPASSLAFGPDSKTLASGGLDTVLLRDITDSSPYARPMTFLSRGIGAIMPMTFSPDGKTLVSGGPQGITLWDVAAHRAVGEPFTDPTEEITDLGFSPDGKTLTLVGHATVVLWDISNAQPQCIYKTSTGRVGETTNVALSPDGKMIVSTNKEDGTVILWDSTTEAEILRIEGSAEYLGSGTNRVAFSPDGKMLAAVGVSGVTVWDIAEQRPIGEPFETGFVSGLAFSPDGKTLALSNVDEIELWDVTTSQPVGRSLTHPREKKISTPFETEVLSLAFSPDGQTLASGSQNKTIALWDVATQQLIGHPLKGHQAPVVRLVFSPDGKTLASGSLDGSIISWDVSSESWRDRACRIANRDLTQREWGQFISTDVPYERTCPDLPTGD